MKLYQIDDAGSLFISPALESWQPLTDQKITTVFDVDEEPDPMLPTVSGGGFLYVYFWFEDRGLPDLVTLHNLGRLGADLIACGHRVLSHCGMGHNRSALLAGVMLTYLGHSGEEAIARIRARRQGALYNHVYSDYLASLPVMRPASLAGLPEGMPGLATASPAMITTVTTTVTTATVSASGATITAGSITTEVALTEVQEVS